MIQNLIQQENHMCSNFINIPNLWKPKLKQQCRQNRQESRKISLEGQYLDSANMIGNHNIGLQLNCKKIYTSSDIKNSSESQQNSLALRDIQNLQISRNNDDNYIDIQCNKYSFQQQRTRHQKTQKMQPKRSQTQAGTPGGGSSCSQLFDEKKQNINCQTQQLSENNPNIIMNNIPKINHQQIQLNYTRKTNDFMSPKYIIKKSKHANSTKENEPNNTIDDIQKINCSINSQRSSPLPQQSHHFSHITPLLHNLNKRVNRFDKPPKNPIKKNTQIDHNLPLKQPTIENLFDSANILFLPPNIKPKDPILKNKVRSNKNYKQLYYNIQRIQNNYKQMQQKFSDQEDDTKTKNQIIIDKNDENSTNKQFEKWANDSQSSGKNLFYCNFQDEERRGASEHQCKIQSATHEDYDRKVKKVASEQTGIVKVMGPGQDDERKTKNQQKNNYLNIRFNQNEIKPWDNNKDLIILDDLC